MKIWSFIVAALVSSAVNASEPCLLFYANDIKGKETESDSLFALLNNQRNSGCLLGPTDSTGIKTHYQKLLAKPTGEDLGIQRGLLLEMMLNEFDGVDTRSCDGLAPECVADRQETVLHTLDDQIRAGAFKVDDDSRNRWLPSSDEGEVTISNINVFEFLQLQCKGKIDELVCANAIALSAKTMRTGIAANELITSYQQPVIGINERFMSGRDKEWESYLNGASVQFPWELAFNSWRFNKKTDDQDLFPRAPNHQWVLFHPSPAFEMIDAPDNSGSMEAAIVVELVGYQRWRWSSGQQHNRWGASAIISVADINGMDTVGYGALIHTPIKNTSIGVISRDGDDGNEVGVVLNVNLASLMQKYNNSDLLNFLNR